VCQTPGSNSKEAVPICSSTFRSPRFSHLTRIASVLAAVFTLVVVSQTTLAQEPAAAVEPPVTAGAASFGYWAPEFRELHIRIPLVVGAIGGEEEFRPSNVQVNGERVSYSYWYFDGVTFDYHPMKQVSRKKIEVFIAYPWKGEQEYTVKLAYSYGGKAGSKEIKGRAPKGGVWAASDGGNFGFTVREEAGLKRQNEPVEFDVTLPANRFDNPVETVRATLMTRPGEFQEIPSQVYNAQMSNAASKDGEARTVRFRVLVQLSLPARGDAIVFLWHCPGERKRSFTPLVKVEGGAVGGTIETEQFKIKLDDKSGQLLTWEDKTLKTVFDCLEPSGTPPYLRAMHYTPDAYRPGASWSHVEDWVQPPSQETRGLLFYETVRLGAMPGVPELETRATYRFYAGRPDVRYSSVMRVVKEVDVRAFRNGGMIQRAGRFTHVAWPRQDGSIKRVPVTALDGNDTGSPPIGRMDASTPWVAFYNPTTKIGLAVITMNQSYFETGGGQPNRSNSMYYVSFYRGKFLYTLRALNINYSANIRTMPSPMSVGTTAYEEMAFLPFSVTGNEDQQFAPVVRMRKELLSPLVIVP